MNFAQGLDTKTDPWQVKAGKFLSLVNSVFTKGNLLEKRNSFVPLTSLPEGANPSTLTTYKDNLIALGDDLFSFSQASGQWEDKGFLKQVSLSTTSLVRSAYSQTVCDSAVSDNALVCVAFLDGDGVWKYRVLNSNGGETLINSTSLPSGSIMARTFVLGRYFIITFLRDITGTEHLQYIAIPMTDLNSPSAAVNVSSQVSGTSAGYDGFVANNSLYMAWDGSDGGGAIRITYLDSTLTLHSTVVKAGHTATLMSVTADITTPTPTIWVTAYAANNAYSYALTPQLVSISGPNHTITTETVTEITSTAQNGSLELFYEVSNNYSFAAIRTDYIRKNSCTSAGVVGTASFVSRSVGLASKAALVDGISYFLTAQSSVYQPSYFFMDQSGNVIGRLAYSNGAGYASTQVLPSITMINEEFFLSYLIKDLVQPVNKKTSAGFQTQIYTQTGVNLAGWNFALKNRSTVETAGTLISSGGFPWMYDGVKPVELGFNLWPENIKATPDAIAGSMGPGTYNYQVTYEWTDGQGNVHRSAPSVPLEVILTTQTEVVLDIPTLRLTYKTSPNAVRIVVYRWSAAQQVFYQVTSVSSPLINNPAVDSVSYTDTQSDAQILGNEILYTTGGVVENIAPPATDALALYKNRLFLIDAEDKNLLWFSKQLIENVPVEMSDLFTDFISPTSGAQGSTGDMQALAPMDDKLVIFKPSAIYYITGTGPDNTGSQNDFSDAVFITSTIGTSLQESICFIPQGLTFQTKKGIWLLGRDLSSVYVGASVELFNDSVVTSAVSLPTQNQARYTFDPALSSTLYLNSHTVLNSDGVVMQESEDSHTDGLLGTMLQYNYFYDQWGTFDVSSRPTLLSFETAWINLAGLQGFERLYEFYLLGKFLSPHKLQMSISYNYNDSPSQTVLITPTNYASVYGQDHQYGSEGPYGGPGNVMTWRVFATIQKCTSFKISLQEVFDDSYSTVPGAGFTLSGIDMVLGAKSQFPRLRAGNQIG